MKGMVSIVEDEEVVTRASNNSRGRQ